MCINIGTIYSPIISTFSELFSVCCINHGNFNLTTIANNIIIQVQNEVFHSTLIGIYINCCAVSCGAFAVTLFHLDLIRSAVGDYCGILCGGSCANFFVSSCGSDLSVPLISQVREVIISQSSCKGDLCVFANSVSRLADDHAWSLINI